MPARDQVTLGILAGGQGSRLGGADKALAKYRGRSLLSRIIQSAGGGFANTLVSYNGDDASVVNDVGWLTLRDSRPGFPGPMVGLETMLSACRTDWLLTFPVDTRDMPDDLSARLLAGESARVVVDADGLQPLAALWNVERAAPAVRAALDAGRAAVHRLVESLAMQPLDISPQRLGNLNTPEDFQ